MAPPQCEFHHHSNRPCASQMVYASGKPFLYRVYATVYADGDAQSVVISKGTFVFCENHRAEQEKAVLGSESVQIEWELISESDSKAKRI